jgi:hypothetical protein
MYYDHLVYFWPLGNLVAIWHTLTLFGKLCQEKSGNPDVKNGIKKLFYLDTLSGHAEDGVAHPLDLRVDGSLARKNHDNQLQSLETVFLFG